MMFSHSACSHLTLNHARTREDPSDDPYSRIHTRDFV